MDTVPINWTLCAGATCEQLGTEEVTYTTDNGWRFEIKLCIECLKQANTLEGLDFLFVVRGHIQGRGNS